MSDIAAAQPATTEAQHSIDPLRHLPRIVRDLVPAGRAFLAAYQRLERGEQAQLRRENPLLKSSFWQCANAARKHLPTAYADRNIQVLARMTPILALPESKFAHSGLNVGGLLRDKKISQRRVESLLTEKGLEEMVSSLEGVLRLGTRKVDFGVLFGDLVFFEVNPTQARESWAKTLFTWQEVTDAAA